ncbi:hypothetical protein DAPPUDRAFT_237752 [Daphnia pulex]|uniref:C1q domain-containing protein n=1 Tax=Daphnia pulex TaxID=6669 RepID=E9G4A7_DAPPU|nr:hypothetical protein DAPPUDRAFT_237752 [Daphnia pulex]|eukprot:EFX85587.1 hypothetical protein DAPPUDRAFT_237752 [Daphnia pulex]
MYWIDPDGQDVGDDPIEVQCDMTSGITSILHDSEEYVEVDNCFDPGCYSRVIHYSASDRQITKLIELSNECHQYFKYDCIEAPFEFNGQQVSWWDDRHGNPQHFWSGKHTSGHTCDCGINGNCIGGSTKKCHCDSRLSYSESDHGIITDKSVLPIKRLHFGHTSTGSGGHTLGRFQCSGQMANQIVNKIPTSCADLRALGHASSGFYFIQGAQKIETVYCEFTKLLTEAGFQTWVGYADLKPEPTHSGMPTSCADLRGIGHTSFSSGMYSIMGRKFVEVVFCDFTKSQDDKGFQTWMGYADLKPEPRYFGVPKSCADLKDIGHTTFSSGLYPIFGDKFVEMVYCDFDKPSIMIGLQRNIGIVDVKSKPTFFYGQRNTPFTTYGSIPFDVPSNSVSNQNVLNIGNAWKTSSDRFEAPVKGRYFFSVSGIATCRTGALTCKFSIFLERSSVGGGIGHAMGEVDMERRDKTSKDSETFSIQATLDLKKGETVWLHIDPKYSSPVATLYDDPRHYTHFIGILLQEDIGDSFGLYRHA